MIGIIFDMDGVLYRGDRPIEGAGDVIEFLKSHKIPFVFLTNNSTKNAAMYREKLQKMGIEVEEEKIITSAYAVAHYLEKHFDRGNLFVIGGKGLQKEIEAIGWPIISLRDARTQWQKIEYVIVSKSFVSGFINFSHCCMDVRTSFMEIVKIMFSFKSLYTLLK